MPWKLLGFLGVIAIIGGAFWFYGNARERVGELASQLLCDAFKTEVINENIKIKEKQDEVLIPSDAVLVDRLLRGTY